MESYDDLLMKNTELKERNDELQYLYEREYKKRIRTEREFYQRSKIKRKLVISAGAILTTIGIAVGSALNTFMDNINRINFGKKELASLVREECLYGIGYREDSVSGFVFNIGEEQVSYEDTLKAIRLRARTAKISDLDLYIGISEIFNSNVASSLFEDITFADIDQRCIEVYLEKELERVRNNGR